MLYQDPGLKTAPGAVPRVRYPHVQHLLTNFQALGLFTVAAIDSSIIPVPVPGSTDLLLLWLISSGGNAWLLVPSAVTGSIFGGYTTWHIGKKGGYAALQRHIPVRFLQPVTRWMDRHPILTVFLPTVLPPPIPLTPFVLASGALGITRRRFLIAFGVARSVRYMVVAWLGIAYGRQVVGSWSRTLENCSTPLIVLFVLLLLSGVSFSIWQARTRNRRGAMDGSPETSRAD